MADGGCDPNFAKGREEGLPGESYRSRREEEKSLARRLSLRSVGYMELNGACLLCFGLSRVRDAAGLCPQHKGHGELPGSVPWLTSDVVLPLGCTIPSARHQSAGDKRQRGQVPPSPSGYR